jgi:hypothetical protein
VGSLRGLGCDGTEVLLKPEANLLTTVLSGPMHSKLETGLVLMVARFNFVLLWWILLEERIRDIAW